MFLCLFCDRNHFIAAIHFCVHFLSLFFCYILPLVQCFTVSSNSFHDLHLWSSTSRITFTLVLPQNRFKSSKKLIRDCECCCGCFAVESNLLFRFHFRGFETKGPFFKVFSFLSSYPCYFSYRISRAVTRA